MLLTCNCGATNRIPSLPKSKVRCGKCQHVFVPGELAKARPEPAPQGFSLTNEDDGPEEPMFTCKDDDCGWEGTEDEADTNANDQPVCPECGKRVRRTDD